MISRTMQDALNEQINLEQFSAQLYLAMSAHCDSRSFKGFAQWLKVQSGEESAHAVKLVDFLLDRGGELELRPIAAPPKDFGGIIQVFEQTLDHEKGITAKISALFERARAEKDYASEIALQWYVTEQVEEEKNSSHVLESVRRVGDNQAALVMLDRELGQRSVTAGQD